MSQHLSPKESLEFMEFQMEVVNRYLPLLEDLGADVCGLQPFDLLIIHGHVCHDSWFSQRTMEAREQWEAANPAVSSAQKMLADTVYDFPRTAAQRMSEDEKRALGKRVGLS
jgi:hypothetical protein